jgi:hypothetical protein
MNKIKRTQLEEELRRRQLEEFMRLNPLVIDDEIEERFESW